MSELEDIPRLTLLVREGDPKAFEQIFNTYYAGLCNYVNSFVHDVQATEDLVQSVFLKIWEKRERLSPEKNLLALLFTSGRNAALNHLKHQKIEQEWENTTNARLSSESNSSTIEIEVSQLASDIDGALEKLPEKQRIIFILSRFYGLSHKEIADVQGISVKTVETHIGRALHFLSKTLSAYLKADFR